MTNEDRIQQAAKEYAAQLKIAHPHDTQTSVDTWRLDFQRGMEKEYTHWQPVLSEKDNRIEHLLDVLHFERTGMAKALAGIVKLTESYRWITEGRGPYAYNDDEYRKEAGYMLDNIEKISSDALSASGAIAHAECCQRERRSVTIENFDYIHKSESDKQLSEKDAAIKELVEGLEFCQDMTLRFMPEKIAIDNRQQLAMYELHHKLKALLTKHKKQ